MPAITLPDGSFYKLHAQVVDLTTDQRAHVTSEGTIISNDRTPGTVAALGVTTTAGLITGAALGGGVGAVVGAGIGAGVSTAIWVNQDTTQTLHEGTEVIFSLNQPMLLENAHKSGSTEIRSCLCFSFCHSRRESASTVACSLFTSTGKSL